jgi:hypothetical protein
MPFQLTALFKLFTENRSKLKKEKKKRAINVRFFADDE